MGPFEKAEILALLTDVRLLRLDIVEAAAEQAAMIDAVRPRHRYSATNLVHYLELRTHDVRDLQARLSRFGLSSLGRTESHVLASIDTLLHTLTLLAGYNLTATSATSLPSPPSDIPDGAELLRRNAERLLGPQPEGRSTRIMVTLPSETATDSTLVRDLLVRGMSVARINCAHDDPEIWRGMIANIRAAESATGKRCLISMDLAGPKLRTGPIQPGPQVLRVKPVRNDIGVVLAPGFAWLGMPENPSGTPTTAPPTIPLTENGWAGQRQAGEKIRLTDARGARRILTVIEVSGNMCLVSTRQTVYFVPGTVLSVDPGPTPGTDARVGTLPAVERALLVRRGDRLVLTDDLTPAEGSSVGVHRIGCTLAEALTDARPSERVLLDDGKIGGVITDVTAEGVTIDIRYAGANGAKLRAEKGINFPDTALSISAVTAEDILDLEFIRPHADIVNMSFVRSASDVQELIQHLDPIDHHTLDIVLKIETVTGFESLPEILLTAMRWDAVGVMIARGDLGVETGFERLAEVQEEILWLCEAGHVPVIWATQVLDSLARAGLPSRAEVTDAAMAERAECVMLNKGPFIPEAVTMLADILTRMQGHTNKKRSLLRRLRAWDRDNNATGQPAEPRS
ncbi:pyruvate kinase [Cryobacterium fucosi]|uniref:pyruvate kinase n=1 Tax=Cryobacterium fucosi TaxID=1259157 RepID=A0A4R9B9S1_9MICO|nr:pyruvate kinase [Cryobacterium fucosi]TFD79198.1 pyruvate kinase [Cryobacterium fucosi]